MVDTARRRLSTVFAYTRPRFLLVGQFEQASTWVGRRRDSESCHYATWVGLTRRIHSSGTLRRIGPMLSVSRLASLAASPRAR